MIQKCIHSIWTGDEPTRLFEPLSSKAKYQLASLSSSMRATFCNYVGKKQVQHSGYFQKQFLEGGFEA